MKPLRKIQQPVKGRLQRPIHPVGCVSLPTHYKNCKLDLLYLVVEGNVHNKDPQLPQQRPGYASA